MQGFYTVEFQGTAGLGGGVAVLSNDTIIGGDSAYMYRGTYHANGDTLTATVNVEAFIPGVSTVLPVPLNRFTLQITGQRRNGFIEGTGSAVGFPAATINIRMTKRS